MNIDDWLKLKQEELGRTLTEEAIKLQLLKGKKIGCTLRLQSSEFTHELVYPVILSEDDKKQILGLDIPKKYQAILKLLVEENPREFMWQRDNWWDGVTQQTANTKFRSTNMPWRIIVVGDWKDCKIHIGTAVETPGTTFLGRLRYKLNGVLLENSRILFNHRNK